MCGTHWHTHLLQQQALQCNVTTGPWREFNTLRLLSWAQALAAARHQPQQPSVDSITCYYFLPGFDRYCCRYRTSNGSR